MHDAGVYLSLKGVVYPNNSHIPITEIGQTDTSVSPPSNSNNRLQCITDRMPCCGSEPNIAGQWFFPNGGVVPTIGTGVSMATTFYRTRGDDGTVHLNHVNNDVMMPTGRFCCLIPDATSTNVTVCAIIG